MKAGARGACQTRTSGTGAMRQHGEEPRFARRARAGKLACRRGAPPGCWRARQAGDADSGPQEGMLQHNQANSSHCAEETRCRLFLCARCYRQTLVCSHCDRDQIYCGRECALEARRRNQRAARARYQANIRGRETHAERSRRYRARQRRVTDHGSISHGLADQPAAAAPRAAAGAPIAVITSSLRTSCLRCGKRASAFGRLDPICRPLPRSIEKRSIRPKRRC